MAVILAVNMLVIGIFGSYQTAQAAEIVAGYTALEVIEGILLSFGISIFTTEMVSTLTEDPKTAQDEYWIETQAAHWAEYMEAVYEEERKKGGGGSGPTPTPGVTGSDIPSFKEVIQNMKNTGKIVLGAAAGAGVWECMSKAVSSLWDKVMKTAPPVSYDDNQFKKIKDNDTCSNKVYVGSSYISYVKNGVSTQIYTKWYCNDPIEYIIRLTGEKYNYDYVIYAPNYENGKQSATICNSYIIYTDSSGNVTTNTYVSYSTIEFDHLYENFVYYFNSSYPIYIDEYKPDNLDKALKKPEIWVHPDLQDTYKNNGKLEYPQQAPQPLQIPSIAQLTDLANKLKTNPQQSPNSVQELIDQLKQNPQPQPTVAPNPNPDPNPNPEPNPDPEVTPKPDDTTTDVNPDDYKADLRLVFPFCIPFDLIHLIQAFEAEPEAPVFEFPFDLELENPWTGKKILDYHHVFKLDMSDYEPVIKIFRIFEIIFFIIGLLMITRQQMIKG